MAGAVAPATEKSMPVFFVILLFLTPSFQKSQASKSHVVPKKSTESMLVPVCSEPDSHLRRIGWGKFGPQFDVPMQEVEVLGGEPDVDYVRYVIKPKTGDGYLEFWFGPTAMSPDPDKELLENSVGTQKRKTKENTQVQIARENCELEKLGGMSFLPLVGWREQSTKPHQRIASCSTGLSISVCYLPSGR